MKILISFVLFISGVATITAQDNSIENKGVEEIFLTAEKMPVYPGCDLDGTSQDEKMNCTKKEIASYIINNLKYPESARKEKIQGKVITKFIINKDGSMGKIWIEKDIGGNCGEAAKEVLIAMSELEPWTPAMQRGKAVKVMYTLPFTFKL